MDKRDLIASSLILCCCMAPAVSAATPDCGVHAVPDQKLDPASVRRVEYAWLTAELHGDVDTVTCLLTDDYRELAFDGVVHDKSDIVKAAAKRKGASGPVTEVTWTGIVVQGDSAIAYSVQDKHDAAGKPIKVFFTDSFVFRDGAWHPYFSVNAVAASGAVIKD